MIWIYIPIMRGEGLLLKGLRPFKLPLINDLRLGETVWVALVPDLNKTYVGEIAKLLIPIQTVANQELIRNGETQIVNSN